MLVKVNKVQMKSFNSVMNYFSFKVTEVKSYKNIFFYMFYLKIQQVEEFVHTLQKQTKKGIPKM